ncbi:inositol-3-phosphate synthase [Micromonospora sp. NPDC007208]|uniref:inositol-3-phosphate synthase n=1 Tax=Micromonospora sp. NPDC007208 TaxID=3364236 RepID=UPI0036A90F78
MVDHIRMAVAGVGNNVSALLQGIEYYRPGPGDPSLVGVTHPELNGIRVEEIQCVAAFDVDPTKIGQPLTEAIHGSTNNFPQIVDLVGESVTVEQGILSDQIRPSGVEQVVQRLRDTEAEVLLLSLPTSRPAAALAYAEAALSAGVAVVNCSADPVAREPGLLRRFASASLPLLGDDLASQFGSSLIHRALLDLLARRGLQIDGTYQVNLGGNEDFRNLRDAGAPKLTSKLNVLSTVPGVASLSVIPSGGHVPFLMDRKVAHISIEGRGWAGSRVAVDVRLEVQDSSNAAGVIVDLVRIAADGRRRRVGGFLGAASTLLKSPPPAEDGWER